MFVPFETDQVKLQSKIRSPHLLLIFYQLFYSRGDKQPIENGEQVRRSNFN